MDVLEDLAPSHLFVGVVEERLQGRLVRRVRGVDALRNDEVVAEAGRHDGLALHCAIMVRVDLEEVRKGVEVVGRLLRPGLVVVPDVVRNLPGATGMVELLADLAQDVRLDRGHRPARSRLPVVEVKARVGRCPRGPGPGHVFEGAGA
ncbi:MAG: hypothetical protein ACYTKD_32090 [Planctomycetota bacterium]